MKQVAGGIVKNKDGKIAIVSQLNGTFWTLPLGHIEANENVLESAAREIKEETGLTHLKLLKELPTYTRLLTGPDGKDVLGEERLIHVFVFSTEQSDFNIQDADIQAAQWVDASQALSQLTHKEDRKYFQDVLSLI